MSQAEEEAHSKHREQHLQSCEARSRKLWNEMDEWRDLESREERRKGCLLGFLESFSWVSSPGSNGSSV